MSKPVTVQQRGKRVVTLKRDGKPISAGDIQDGQTITFDATTGEISKIGESWYCWNCAVEVYQVRCVHCGKTKRETK